MAHQECFVLVPYLKGSKDAEWLLSGGTEPFTLTLGCGKFYEVAERVLKEV